MVSVLATAAVAATAAPGGAAAATEPFVRTCDTHVEGPVTAGEPSLRAAGRFGRLVFIGLDRRHRWQLRRGADGNLKIPVLIHEGAPITIRITPLGRTRARLDFDPGQWSSKGRRVADGDGQRAVRFDACPAQRPRFSDGKPLGPWTGYHGGFLVDRPGCARLTASARGMLTVRRRIALGVPIATCRA